MLKHRFNIFPEMQPEDYQRLKNDIDVNDYDVRYPIWFYEGAILDGWNRERACKELGIEPVYAEFIGSDMEAIEFVMRTNNRRDLTSSQRACIAVEAEDIVSVIKKSAELKMLSGKADPGQLIAQGNPMDNKTATKVANIFNTNRTYYNEAKKLSPEVFKEVKSGIKTIPEVKKEENRELKKERERNELIQNAIQEPIIVNADCLSIFDTIPEIDLLIADPPYFTDGDFINAISKYLTKVKQSGQAYIFASADPKELIAYLCMDLHGMELTQVLIWNYNNTGQRQPNIRYTSNYQICFYLRGKDAPNINKPADGKEQYACQIVNAPDARRDERYFKWQKPDELIERFIRNSSNPGDFVFDPFAGSGTTLVTASKLGRIAKGCDVDKEMVKICIERGCKNE